jgi:ribosomal protein L7Ae-like RNA K-turn-binding protein
VAGADGTVHPDFTGRLAGKAAYVLPERKRILAAAPKLAEALGLATAPAAKVLLADLTDRLRTRWLGAVGMARKAGAVTTGTDKVCDGTQSGRVVAVLLATDTADHTVERVTRTAAQVDTPVFRLADREALSAALGQPNCAVAGLLDKPQARPALEGAMRLSGLIE